MGIYTYPTGIFQKLQVQGTAIFDASVYFTGVLECATGARLDASTNIGDASTEEVGFFGVGGATQWDTIADVNAATDTTANVVVLQAIINAMEAIGLCAT